MRTADLKSAFLVFKRRQGDILGHLDRVAKVNNVVKDEVKRAVENWSGIGQLDGIVNNRIEATDDLTDEFKDKINDESADKTLETLKKYVKNMWTRNDKSEKEITTVKNGVDIWRSEVNKMKGQILEEVKEVIKND